MAKRKKTETKKTVKRKAVKKPEAKQVEVRADEKVLRGSYANHIQVSIQDEEFVFDFFARIGEKAALVSRIFVAPQHAERFRDLLRRQVAAHKRLHRVKAKKR